eukprot:42799-Chlamydomonas_euryale.AAC.1
MRANFCSFFPSHVQDPARGQSHTWSHMCGRKYGHTWSDADRRTQIERVHCTCIGHVGVTMALVATAK